MYVHDHINSWDMRMRETNLLTPSSLFVCAVFVYVLACMCARSPGWPWSSLLSIWCSGPVCWFCAPVGAVSEWVSEWAVSVWEWVSDWCVCVCVHRWYMRHYILLYGYHQPFLCCLLLWFMLTETLHTDLCQNQNLDVHKVRVTIYSLQISPHFLSY